MTEEQENGVAPKGDGKAISLRSLAPEYVEDEHALYVEHLSRAVDDETVRNVALTGRYGSGKSSVLDKFIEAAGAKSLRVQRISINTLGPDEGEDITNRIQKELVKQLVYRAAPGMIRRSRFARTAELTGRQLVWQSAVVAVVVAALLWLTGVRPSLGFGGDGWWPQPVAFVLLVVLFALATGVARRSLRTRRVSQVSAAGTAIQLEDQPDSYFDKYLDELMVYFEITDPDIVIFEDLDRFDDPQIFDSLRELNTLINSSYHWASPHEPLRFVYAIKDSLFEKLGKETPKSDEPEVGKDPAGENSGAEKVAIKGGTSAVSSGRNSEPRDPAAAAVERANRTKFFEVVIPIVPFLSHSNARDHLIGLLEAVQARDKDKISRGLIDIVARHSTDMRLMINIRNEYVVFAQRLLWGGKGAPGLEANALFALVAYKNFHLADFEALPHRGSVLDTLESKRRTFVRKAIEELEKERRDLHRVNAVLSGQQELAEDLGGRLTLLHAAIPWSIRRLEVDREQVDIASAKDPSFWERVSQAGGLTMLVTDGHTNRSLSLDSDLFAALFHEGADPSAWLPADDRDIARERSKIDQKIATLRGESYGDLARDTDLEVDGKTFESHLAFTLQSDLARDLVRRGFIDRYYAEYAAVFYGKFLGVDVANFFRNAVWPNEMDLDAEFESAEAISNVLEQAPEGFTSSRSVLNAPIVRYLLGERPELAREVVDYLVTHEGNDSAGFLKAFFAYVDKDSTKKTEMDLPDEAAVEVDPAKTGLVTLLAAHPWPGLFDYLAGDDSVPDEGTRTALLDAALLGTERVDILRLNDDAAALIRERHQTLDAFTQEPEPPGSDASAVVFALAERADLEVPDLRPLSKGMRERFVTSWRYELTADNLRIALELSEESPIGLEELYGNGEVWGYCRTHLDDYLAAVENDPHTESTATTSEALVRALNDKNARWSEEQKCHLIGATASSASIPDSREAPGEAWPLLAAVSRLVPSLGNLAKYGVEHGVDQSLARLLAPVDSKPVTIVDLQEVETDVAREFIVQVLNANGTLTLDARVAIARQVYDRLGLEPVDADALKPSGEDLLARLLEAKMVPDTAESFAHFLASGWAGASAAFRASQDIHEFLTPDLIAGHEMDLLQDAAVPDRLKEKVLGEFDAYLSDVTDTVLAAVLPVARRLAIPVPLPHLARVAAYAPAHDDVLWHLVEATKSTQPDPDGPLLLQVLAALGDHYSDFAGGSGTEIVLERTELLDKVIQWLRDAQLLTYTGGTNQWRLKLKLL